MQLNVVSYWRLPVASTSFTCCCMRDSRGFSVSPVAQADGTPFTPDWALSRKDAGVAGPVPSPTVQPALNTSFRG